MVETEQLYREISGLNKITSHMWGIHTTLADEEVRDDTRQIFLDTIKTFKSYEAEMRSIRQELENKYRVYAIRNYLGR